SQPSPGPTPDGILSAGLIRRRPGVSRPGSRPGRRRQPTAGPVTRQDEVRMSKQAPLTRYVALLRGINLGNRRVKMDHLRRLFEDLKFADVATDIPRRNVLLPPPEPHAAP